VDAHQRIHTTEFIEAGVDGGIRLCASGRVNGDRDERAEQWLAAAKELKVGRRCLATDQ